MKIWKRIQAEFIGQDGSMGFKKGKIYSLKYALEALKLNGKPRKDYIVLTDIFTGKACPYESERAVLANWKILKGELVHDNN